jgi:hypothetical protein
MKYFMIETNYSSCWAAGHLNMGPIGSTETTVTNYQSTLRNIPEERRSHLKGGLNLKSRILILLQKNWLALLR